MLKIPISSREIWKRPIRNSTLGSMAQTRQTETHCISFPMGIGDYYNVFNCLTQVPKGGLVYMSGMHSYWYLPEEG